MRSRSTNLRTKVVALLASLVALWAFAAWVTVRDGFNLLGVQTLNTAVAEPSEPLVLQLQQERRLSLAYLGRPDGARRDALAQERSRTDKLAAAFAESAGSWRAEVAAGADLERRVAEVNSQLAQLDEIRSAVDDRSVDRLSTFTAYRGVIDSLFTVYTTLGGLDDRQIAADTSALIELNRARELLSEEDGVLTGVLAAGRITPAERSQLAQIIGAQRFAAELAVSRLSSADRNRYAAMTTGPSFTRLRTLEDGLLQARTDDPRLTIKAQDWEKAAAPALTQWSDVVVAGGDDVVGRATPVAIGVIVRLVLATGLGLLAVIASIVVSITTARALVLQLERLREAAFRLANERLPGVVERLGHGEEVDVAREAPPLQFGDDEIGQVGKAFNAVQETAIRTAVEQAELRRSVREVFLSLARRTQALVHRQLTLLDAMERREHDAEELEDLFRVDHLATRMRRNAENLIVLSGSTPGRSWRRNVPMVDVVRGAVAEVEDYTRVNVLPLGPVSLAGRAVGDIIHLLAELIENGLSFSPPHTTVEVRGLMVANGFAVEIEDRGLGMSHDELGAANHRIVDRSELNLANASRLGLYVVSRLTERHGVRVQLKESAYGGTTAVVLIPLELVTDDGPDPATSGGFRTGTGFGPATAPPVAARAPESGRPSGPAVEQPTARVALAEEPAPPDAGDGRAEPPDAAPDRSEAAGTDPLPTTPSGLPARARRRQPALDDPTVPTGLTTIGRPTEDAPARAATGESVPVTAESVPVTAESVPVTAEPVPATGESVPVTGESAAGAESEATAPVAAAPVRTDSGLPVRVRQASIAPALRDEPSESDAGPDEDAVRPPEQVRRMMSSYQSGTRRGRTDAARLLGGAAREPGGGPDTGDEQAT